MLGQVVTCHGRLAQEMLGRLKRRFGPLAQYRAANYQHSLSSNMLSQTIYDALYIANSRDGVVFLTDRAGVAPYRTAALASHKRVHCEIISGVDYSLLE